MTLNSSLILSRLLQNVPTWSCFSKHAITKHDSSARPQTRKLGQKGGSPRQNTSKSAPVIEKTMFNMCFYPYGVHIIKVLVLGPLLAILIFQGSQMTLMATKMAMFFAINTVGTP